MNIGIGSFTTWKCLLLRPFEVFSVASASALRRVGSLPLPSSPWPSAPVCYVPWWPEGAADYTIDDHPVIDLLLVPAAGVLVAKSIIPG